MTNKIIFFKKKEKIKQNNNLQDIQQLQMPMECRAHCQAQCLAMEDKHATKPYQ